MDSLIQVTVNNFQPVMLDWLVLDIWTARCYDWICSTQWWCLFRNPHTALVMQRYEGDIVLSQVASHNNVVCSKNTASRVLTDKWYSDRKKDHSSLSPDCPPCDSPAGWVGAQHVDHPYSKGAATAGGTPNNYSTVISAQKNQICALHWQVHSVTLRYATWQRA